MGASAIIAWVLYEPTIIYRSRKVADVVKRLTFPCDIVDVLQKRSPAKRTDLFRKAPIAFEYRTSDHNREYTLICTSGVQ